MKKIKKIFKIIITIAIIIAMDITLVGNVIYANENFKEVQLLITNAYEPVFKCKQNKYNLYCTKYRNDVDGRYYPAYSFATSGKGVEDDGAYSVRLIREMEIHNLWKIIENGYAYKTPEELGCSSEKEAYIATSIAIYLYMNSLIKIQDFLPLEGHEEEGKKILEKSQEIMKNAENSNTEKPSDIVTITSKSQDWEQDELDEKSLSKTYSVTSENKSMQNYKVTLEELKEQIPEAKIVDKNNQEKTEFGVNEDFKIIIPLKNIEEQGEFNIRIETKLKTQKLYMGEIESVRHKNYLIPGEEYEIISTQMQDLYPEIEVIDEENNQYNYEVNHTKDTNSTNTTTKTSEIKNTTTKEIITEKQTSKTLPITGM